MGPSTPARAWLRLPHSLPYVFAGLRVAVVLSVVGACLFVDGGLVMR